MIFYIGAETTMLFGTGLTSGGWGVLALKWTCQMCIQIVLYYYEVIQVLK